MNELSKLLRRFFQGTGDNYTTPVEAAAIIESLVTGSRGLPRSGALNPANEHNPAVALAYHLCHLIRKSFPPAKGDIFASKDADDYILLVAHLIRVGELNIFVGDPTILNAGSIYTLPAALRQFLAIKMPEQSAF
ncbi:MAG: hypothetical protein JW739_01570 [Opitutales bacterium]|nr:hypothetical protein [Opitutales bacterium]